MFGELERIERKLINKTTEKLNLPVSSVACLFYEGNLNNTSEEKQKRFEILDGVAGYGNILLIQRAEDDSIALPAGHVENNEHPIEAMVRETKEELNLLISPDNLIQVGSFPRIKNFNFVNRLVYTYQLPIGDLYDLGHNWKHAIANVYIDDPTIGADIDFWFSVGTPKTSNPEVKRLIMVSENVLGLIRNVSHFGGHIDVYLENGEHTRDFFKWEITRKLHSLLPVPHTWY